MVFAAISFTDVELEATGAVFGGVALPSVRETFSLLREPSRLAMSYVTSLVVDKAVGRLPGTGRATNSDPQVRLTGRKSLKYGVGGGSIYPTLLLRAIIQKTLCRSKKFSPTFASYDVRTWPNTRQKSAPRKLNLKLTLAAASAEV